MPPDPPRSPGHPPRDSSGRDNPGAADGPPGRLKPDKPGRQNLHFSQVHVRVPLLHRPEVARQLGFLPPLKDLGAIGDGPGFVVPDDELPGLRMKIQAVQASLEGEGPTRPRQAPQRPLPPPASASPGPGVAVPGSARLREALAWIHPRTQRCHSACQWTSAGGGVQHLPGRLPQKVQVLPGGGRVTPVFSRKRARTRWSIMPRSLGLSPVSSISGSS